MIKFEELEETRLEHFNNGEGFVTARLFKDDNVKIMKGTIKKGNSIGKHTHTDSAEIIYVLSGEAHIILDGSDEYVKPGECHYCPKGSTHEMRNEKDEDLISINIVTKQ